MQFASPGWFLLLIPLAALIWLQIRRSRRGFPAVPFPSSTAYQSLKRRDSAVILGQTLPWLTFAGMLLIIIALARQQSVSQGQDVQTEGIDIIMALDISGSMRAKDFQPDRAEAAKKVAKEFIAGRNNDRIGMVLFAKQAFTQCPLTIDHEILNELIDGTQVGLVDPDATAIGQALGASLNRLKESESKSKVVILLTDGENNFGQSPSTLSEAAKAMGVRVYTIGVGRRGTAPYPMVDVFGREFYQDVQVNIDEDLLTEIAAATGGKYFRATDENKLLSIFKEIDSMEKTRIQVTAVRRFAELFYRWTWPALGLLMLGWLISSVVARRLA